MKLDLRSLFGLIVTHVMCTAVLIGLAETPQLPLPPAFGLIKRGALLVS
jgi:hypothetical protein